VACSWFPSQLRASKSNPSTTALFRSSRCFAEGVRCRLQRALDLRGTDVKMSHGADRPWPHRAHSHAARKKRREHLLRVGGALQLEDHDVRFDGGRVERYTGQLAKTFGEPPRIEVVFREPVEVVAQRDPCRKKFGPGDAHQGFGSLHDGAMRIGC